MIHMLGIEPFTEYSIVGGQKKWTSAGPILAKAMITSPLHKLQSFFSCQVLDFAFETNYHFDVERNIAGHWFKRICLRNEIEQCQF